MYVEPAEQLSAVEASANEFENLLKTQYGYDLASNEIFRTNKFVNIETGDKLMQWLEAVLSRWLNKQHRGATLGRLILYYQVGCHLKHTFSEFMLHI